MGLESSRAVVYPSNIDELEQNIVKKIKTRHLNTKGGSTLGSYTLEKAAKLILTYLTNNHYIDNCRILDVFSGNGVASNIIQTILNVEMKSTDALDLSRVTDDSSYPVEYNLTGADAVRKYARHNYNTLLMVSPPPSSPEEENYGDYYTIREWSKVKSAKLFIFIGEMGASDGSEGLYHYMMHDNPYWKLGERHMLYKASDGCGGNVEKELFIFYRRSRTGQQAVQARAAIDAEIKKEADKKAAQAAAEAAKEAEDGWKLVTNNRRNRRYKNLQLK